MIQEIFSSPWPAEYYPNLTLEDWCEKHGIHLHRDGVCFVKNNKIAVWSNEILFYVNRSGVVIRIKVEDYKQVIYILEKFWL